MCGNETRAWLRLCATGALALGGVILIGMGLYFVFLRPALLPEDARFMGATAAGIQGSLPGLTLWLQRVFGVMGGFMVAAGLLTVHVALTTFRAARPGAAMIVAVSGLASIGGMAVTNFAIRSDFRWLLLAFTLPWLVALALAWAAGRQGEQSG